MIENLDEVLNKLSIKKQLCKGPIWESISKKLNPEFGPKDILGVLTHYALLEQKDPNQETLPPQLELQEFASIVELVANQRNKAIPQEDLIRYTYETISEIYDNQEKYYFLIYCLGPTRPSMNELKQVFKESFMGIQGK